MERFVWFIQKQKKAVIGIILLITAFCVLLMGKLQVGFDWSDYLPEDSGSVIAEKMMEQEFSGGLPNLEVQLSNVSVPEALEYKRQIQALDSVQQVFWLDDMINIYEPLEFQNNETIEVWYQNQTAFLKVVVSEDNAAETVGEIRQIIGMKGTMEGILTDYVDQEAVFEKELRYAEILILSVLAVLLVLTLESWGNALLIFLTVLIAGVINEGTDVLFGELFYLTRASEMILQIPLTAVCAMKCLEFVEHKNSFRMMFSKILLILLCSMGLAAMRFELGKEMALVFMKTTAVSAGTAVLLTPAWNALFHGWIRRTRHRQLNVNLSALAKGIFKLRVVIPLLLIPVFLTAFLAQRQTGYQAQEEYSDVLVLMVPSAEQAFGSAEKERAMNDELNAVEGVDGVVSYLNNVGNSYPAEYLEETERRQYISENCSRSFILLDNGSNRENTVNAVKTIGDKYYGEYFYLTGEAVETEEVKTLTAGDGMVLAIVFAAVVGIWFLAVLKSLLLSVLCMLMTYGTVWINLAISYFDGKKIWGLNLAPSKLLLVTLAAGTALELAVLYMEFRKTALRRKSMKQVVLAGVKKMILPAVLMAVTAGILCTSISQNVGKELGVLVLRQVLISGIIMTVVFPLWMMWMDRGIELTSLHPGFYRKGNGKE